MPQDHQKIISYLQKIRLFDGLDSVLLDQVAGFTRPILLKEGENLHLNAGDSTFYVIIAGKVRLSHISKGIERSAYVLKQGDFFGADTVFHGRPKAYNLTVPRSALIFSYPVESLRLMLNNLPVLTRNIKKQLAWYNLVRSKPFNWLGEEETVKLVCKKHPAYLFVTELLPLVIAWLGVLAIIFAISIPTTSFRLAVGWSGAAAVSAASLWAIWRFFDWGNDYFIVTDERVVWLERTIALYDSRQEAPLVAIKSGETKSTFTGRLLGYGDLVIQTFMGQVFFRHVRNPVEIKNVIDQERKLAVERQMATDIRTIEGKIRQKIEPLTAATVPGVTHVSGVSAPSNSAPAQEVAASDEHLSFWQSLLARFQTRRVSAGMITYRKHLYVLFTMTWLPAASAVVLMLLTVELYLRRVGGQISLLSPGLILLLGIFLVLIAFLWWLYQFVDWSNDIYRVTPDKLIDSERKPLGDEISRSAPLENIIGLDFERLGLLGVVLNYGNVLINIGTDNKFIFYGIHNPAQAQKDIFNYMYAQRRRKQQTDTVQEQERVSNYIAAYHRQAEDIRQAPKKPPQS